MNLVFDPNASGLQKVFKDYQIEAMKFAWENAENGVTSYQVYTKVNERLEEGRSISRASIINFLDRMVEEGILDYTTKSGKGGYHRIYRPKFDEKRFKKELVKSILSSLMRDFRDETMEVIKNY